MSHSQTWTDLAVRRSRTSALALAAAVATSAMGCVGEISPVGPDEELVGHAEVALLQVPTDATCVKLVAEKGTQTVERFFDVTAGGASTLDFKGLPTGLVTFGGAAYNKSCSKV